MSNNKIKIHEPSDAEDKEATTQAKEDDNILNDIEAKPISEYPELDALTQGK